MTIYEQADRLDMGDPLRGFRDRFIVAEKGVTYLDGNSLGRMPKRTAEVLKDLEKSWGKNLIQGWNDGWIDLPKTLGAKIAELIGAKPNEVIVADSTSINLFKLATAALKHQAWVDSSRTRILTDALNFPSDRYIFSNLAEIDLVNSSDQISISEEAIAQALRPSTALASFSLVAYNSGFMFDGARVTKQVQDSGALVLWDLSHAVGAVEVNLNEWGADLAVGCCYKYLNGGPGAPAFLYVSEEMQEKLFNPIRGWFGHKDLFAFDSNFSPAPGIDRFQVGTPPIVALTAIEPGLDLVLEAGIEKLREKSVAQSEFLISLFKEWLEPLGAELNSPTEASLRGSHVSIGHGSAWRVTQALVDLHRVIPDFRTPNSVRIGITPLYTTYGEIVDAMTAFRTVLEKRQFEAYPMRRGGVT